MLSVRGSVNFRVLLIMLLMFVKFLNASAI